MQEKARKIVGGEYQMIRPDILEIIILCAAFTSLLSIAL